VSAVATDTPAISASCAPRIAPLLQIEELSTHFFTRRGVVKAVDGVTLQVDAGEVLGIVGESGSGKSVTGFSILGLVDPPGRIVRGRISFEGEDLALVSKERLRELRGNRIAMIFQDPMMTLNPILRIETQMVEAIRAHHPGVGRSEARARCCRALAQVGIPSPELRLHAYPGEFSGGMRQRVAIAIALLNRPALLIADEPTTALDVTIQAQILHEIKKLCSESGTAMIWISHDLAVIGDLADRVAVMYAGRIVEEGPVDDVLDRPLHPYTRGLIGSIPSRNTRGLALQQIPGMAPSPLKLPEGCSFRDRCPRADALCRTMPVLEQVRRGHAVRCVHPHMEQSP
jgi:peptide/nickel transport system ATP-binding protein